MVFLFFANRCMISIIDVVLFTETVLKLGRVPLNSILGDLGWLPNLYRTARPSSPTTPTSLGVNFRHRSGDPKRA